MHVSRLGHNSREGKKLLNQRDNAERRTNRYKQTINKFVLLISSVCLNIRSPGLEPASTQDQTLVPAVDGATVTPQPSDTGRGGDLTVTPCHSHAREIN